MNFWIECRQRKIAKESEEEHRLEPYFVEVEKKNFNHRVFKTETAEMLTSDYY